MYKVFFNDRKLFLTDDFTKHFQVNYGLFYKYRSIDDLKELVSFYQQLSKIESLYIFHNDIEELRNSFKQCFFFLNAAGGLVRNQKGEFLLIYKKGKWDLPKGKVDDDESFPEAALREVEEECGIRGLEIVKPLLSTYHTFPHKTGIALKRTCWFEMVCKGECIPTPQIEEGIEEIRWVSSNEIKTYLSDSYPSIADVFTYFGL